MRESQYNYELKKSLMPGFMVKGVKIDEDWVARCKRYMGDTGCDLNRLVVFIKNGLSDRRSEGFNVKALDGRLSVAQQWLVLHLCLKDGIPEWIQNQEKDEDVPELIIPEEGTQGRIGRGAKFVEQSLGSALGTAMRPVTSLKPNKEVQPQEELDGFATDE